jgi:DNA-binding transcriptional MerR regulator
MSDDKQYTISELAAHTGTTPRTIRYYTAEGLLPPPDTRGKYALYSQEHVLRLEIITKLKEAYLPLGEIRARLQPLTSEQLAHLHTELESTTAVSPSSQDQQGEANTETAADYIAHVLGQPIATQQRLNEATQLYAAPQLQAPPTQPGQAPVPSGPPQQAPAPQAPPRTGLLGRLLPRQRHSTPAYDGEQWRRIELAPGIELHIRESLTASTHKQLEQLLQTARRLFREGSAEQSE